MEKTFRLFIYTAAILALVFSASAGLVEKLGNASNQITVLYLKGSPYELGYIHGRSCKTDIAAFYGKVLATAEAVGATSALLDGNYRKMEPYIPRAYQEEMQGLADGAGLPVELVHRMHAIPDLKEFQCSFFAAWGSATVDGNLYQIRALDYAMDLHLQEYPAILVYQLEDGKRFLNIGWLGFIGVISGMNYDGIAVSEIGDHYGNEHETLAGEPMPFILRDILQNCARLQEAVQLIKNAKRTLSYLYCVGDASAKDARSFKTAADICEVYDPTTNPNPSLRDVIYLSMSIGSPWNGKMHEFLRPRLGKIDAETGLSLMRDLGTGNVHAVLYDFARREVRVANASADKIPAYEREFVTFDLDRAKEKFAVYELAVVCEEVNILPRRRLESDRKNSTSDKPGSRIDYELDKEESIEIAIFDTLGNLVATLFSGMQTSGSHQTSWNGKDKSGQDLPDGLYPCKLKSGRNTDTLKLFRIR